MWANIKTALALLGLLKEILKELGKLAKKADQSKAYSDGYQDGKLVQAGGQPVNKPQKPMKWENQDPFSGPNGG